MSHHHTPALPALTIKQYPKFKDITRTDIIVLGAYIANIATCLLLAALVLRIFLSLFLIDGSLWEIIHTITQPFVTPFDNVIPSVSDMFQPGAIVAYCIYFTLYMTILSTIRSSASVKDPI